MKTENWNSLLTSGRAVSPQINCRVPREQHCQAPKQWLTCAYVGRQLGGLLSPTHTEHSCLSDRASLLKPKRCLHQACLRLAGELPEGELYQHRKVFSGIMIPTYWAQSQGMRAGTLAPSPFCRRPSQCVVHLQRGCSSHRRCCTCQCTLSCSVWWSSLSGVLRSWQACMHVLPRVIHGQG